MKKFFENKPRTLFLLLVGFLVITTITAVFYLKPQKNDPDVLVDSRKFIEATKILKEKIYQF